MTRRNAMGQLVDGQYGIDISKPGIDVLAAGVTVFDFLFSSRYTRTGIVHASGLVSRGSTVSFPDLGYVPMAHCVHVEGSQVKYQDYYDPPPQGSYKIGYIRSVTEEPVWEVTSNSLRIVPLYSDDSVSAVYRYVVFKLPGNV